MDCVDVDRTLDELNDESMDYVLGAFPLESALHQVVRLVAEEAAFEDA